MSQTSSRTLSGSLTLLFGHSFSSVVVIIVVELMNGLIFTNGEFMDSRLSGSIWLTVRALTGLFYGFLSDFFRRKMFLIFGQIAGIITCAILSLFGFQIWAVALVALFFSPLSVARASLIDNYPMHTLLVLSITFLAQQAPWAFISYWSKFDPLIMLYCLLGVLAVNVVVTYLFFEDKHDGGSPRSTFRLRHLRNSVMMFMLIAFGLSEAVFYFDWALLEDFVAVPQTWLAPTTVATLIGITLTLLLRNHQDISLITWLYTFGAAAIFSAIIDTFLGEQGADINFMLSVRSYALIGGVYLPLVADWIIRLAGPNHRGVGASFLDIAEAVASVGGAVVVFSIGNKGGIILAVSFVMLMGAAALQKKATKIYKARKSLRVQLVDGQKTNSQ